MSTPKAVSDCNLCDQIGLTFAHIRALLAMLGRAVGSTEMDVNEQAMMLTLIDAAERYAADAGALIERWDKQQP
jgi:hypothetical protein